MKARTNLFILLIITILILEACTKPECTKNTDCTKTYYLGNCVNNKCSFITNPQYQCEDSTTPCAGPVPGSTILEKKCSQDKKECTSTIPDNKITPTSLASEQSMAGDKFKITTNFNQPFNTRKDKLNTKITLQQQSNFNTEEKVTRAELTATTKDGQTITLADEQFEKHLWNEGSEVNIPLILTLPSTQLEGQFTSLILKVYYNYVQTIGNTKQIKESILQNNYANLKFTWAQPEKPYNCPTCNEEGPGMQGTCNTATGFCDYTPIPNTCGNNICEPNKNQCNCPQDCGPCETNTGVYTTKTCTTDNKCIGIIKQGLTIAQKNVLDDRQLEYFHLQNNYKYNNPFNIKTDKVTAEINMYQIQPQITNVKIETIRLLDGQQQIAQLDVNKDITQTGSQLIENITIPPQEQPEIEKNPTIAIWYQYTKNNTQTNLAQKDHFEKPLEKITILSPD